MTSDGEVSQSHHFSISLVMWSSSLVGGMSRHSRGDDSIQLLFSFFFFNVVILFVSSILFIYFCNIII